MSETLRRLGAALADRYRIERELGAGGMATVYLAHDLKHDRDVAIKVLHPDLGAALGGERFLTEIKTTARLQHPHILPLLDSGEAGGLLYYVMPLVTGETLRARLAREKQLGIADALLIAREVADALQYAHGLGVIHRDIKPENILLQNGHALVADFGIALAVQSAGGQRMTQTGLSLGTPQYMSPEQAMGERTIDARSDIYALGAVTYEMLTGDAPFTGSSVQAIVARVLTEKPPAIRPVRDTVTFGIEQAVLRALGKLPADRFASAAEFSAALASDATMPDRGAVQPSSISGHDRRRARVVTAALAVTTVASLAVAAWALARSPAAGSAAIFDAALPDSAPLGRTEEMSATGFGSGNRQFSISPRGDFVVYTAQHGDSTILWRRSLVDASAAPITGTAGGRSPRISPDGKRLAFSSGKRVLIVPIDGGEPRQLADGTQPASLEWISDTRLFTLAGDGFRLTWLDAELGVTEDRPTPGARCIWGQWLAAEKKLLCSYNESATLVDPVTREVVPLTTKRENAQPARSVSGAAFQLVDGAYMIYVALDGTLLGAAYDARTHQLGRAVPLVRGVSRFNGGAVLYDLSPDGGLGYVPAGDERFTAMVVRHEGADAVPLPMPPGQFLRFDLTRDRKRLAAVVGTPEGQELRIYDLRSGVSQVWLKGLTIRMPLWSPRGDRIAVHVEDGSGAALLLGSPDASGAPDTLMRRLGDKDAVDAMDFPDDSTLLARDTRVASIVRLTLSGKSVRVDTLSKNAIFMTRSPDGARVAWHTSQTNQLFTGPYPSGTQQQLIAVGGVEPVWLSPTELLYRSGVTWFVARFDRASGALSGAPRVWARDPRFVDTPGWSNRSSWDGGILYTQGPEEKGARYLRFIPDFVTRLKAAVDGAAR